MVRNAALFIGVVILVAAAVVGGGFGLMSYIDTQRVRDATPAFAPLEPIGAEFLSSPIAFRRNCNYYVQFARHSKLHDGNAEKLLSLNELPTDNHLTLTISTPAVTDQSISVLARLSSVDVLDVTASGVSDTGISRLQQQLPHTGVETREQGAAALEMRADGADGNGQAAAVMPSLRTPSAPRRGPV